MSHCQTLLYCTVKQSYIAPCNTAGNYYKGMLRRTVHFLKTNNCRRIALGNTTIYHSVAHCCIAR